MGQVSTELARIAQAECQDLLQAPPLPPPSPFSLPRWMPAYTALRFPSLCWRRASPNVCICALASRHGWPHSVRDGGAQGVSGLYL